MFVLTYRVACTTVRVELAADVQPLDRVPYRWFRVADGEADICCRWRRVDAASLTLPPPHGDEVAAAARLVSGSPGGWESAVWRSPALRSRLEAALAAPESARIIMRESSVTVLDFAKSEAEFWVVDGGATTLVAGPGLAEVAPFLPGFSSAVVHSLGVVRGGRAGLFLAADGGGKSTVADQVLDNTILNDDQVALRLDGSTLTAHATPWGPVGTGDTSAPLAAFFLLERSDDFGLIPLRPADVLEYLWQEGLVYYHPLPRGRKVQAFDLLRRMSRGAPAYRMRFARDHVDWAAIDAAMAAR